MARDPRSLLPEVIENRGRQFPSFWTSSFPNLWHQFFDDGFMTMAEEQSNVRIYEENNRLHVEASMPGLNANDLEVSLNKGVLLIKGEAKEEEQDKKRKFYRSSRRNYSYSLILPTQVDEKQEPQANYSDGILHISFDIAKSSDTKKIQVKSGNTSKSKA